MRKFIIHFAVLAILLLWSGWAIAQGELQFVKLGNYRLENGQVIRNCRLAFRTFGAVNEDKSNIVLFPTWLAGTTKDLVDLGLIGPGKLADSSKVLHRCGRCIRQRCILLVVEQQTAT